MLAARASTRWRYLGARRSYRKLLLYAVGTLIVLWIGWIVVTALVARQDAASIHDRLERVRMQLATGDLSGARETAASIPALAAHAHRMTTGPAWWTAAELPVVGRPFEIARGATALADDLGRDGVPALLSVAQQLDPVALRTGPDTINLRPLERAAPALVRSDELLERAMTRLRALPSSSWLPPVDSVRTSLEATLEPIAGYVSAGARTAEVLPALLGNSGPQRYFVALQNEAEMRGTGGLPGAYAIAVADHGTLRFVRFGTDGDLQPRATGALIKTGLNFGPAYQAAYAAAGPTETILNSNISPHFPYAAQIWAAMWEKQFGQHIDGAVAIDPQVLANVLSATGPVSVAGLPLGASNAVQLAEQQEYALFPNNSDRNAFLTDALHAVADRITSGVGSPRRLVQAMSLSSREGRVLVWSEDSRVERILEQTNYAGVIPDDRRPFVGMVLNNVAAGKLDYYLRRSLEYQRIGCGPVRDMVVTMTLRNEAPGSGLPPYVDTRLDHPPESVEPGDNRSLLDYYATAGAQLTSVTIDGKQATASVLEDRGHPVFRFDLELPHGSTRTIVLHLSEPAGSGPLDVWRQPGVTPLQVSGVAQSCG